jgi:alkyl hydroperoxide reductase subunit AhpF
MSLLADADRKELEQMFGALTRPVRLVSFTQTFGCDTCLDARRILDEVATISDKLSVDECNIVLEPDRAARYGVDRAPATAVCALDADGAEVDYGVRFIGLTSGYEFSSLVDAILLVSRGDSQLSEESRTLLAAVAEPVRIQVFVTPT